MFWQSSPAAISTVSGSWYSNPHTPSTWNYMSVHVKGRIRFLDDLELDDVLRRTSLHFEDQNEESPTVFDNLPEAFKEKARPMIVGFEVEVEDIDTVFKLSQDRDEKSYQNIIDKLREQGHDGRVIAAEMEARQAHLFETNNNKWRGMKVFVNLGFLLAVGGAVYGQTVDELKQRAEQYAREGQF